MGIIRRTRALDMRRTRFISWILSLLWLTLVGVSLGGVGVRQSEAQSGVTAVVVNDSANVRVAPAFGAEIIASVPSGYFFDIVTGRSGDAEWLRVDFNGDEGWVHIAPLSILSGDVNLLPVGDPRSIPYGGFEAPRSGPSSATSANTVRVTNGLRVRSGPGQGYPTIANMFAGTVVPVFGRTLSNQWIQISYEGTLGWVSIKYVEFMNGLTILNLPIDGIVADAPPIVGNTSNDYFDTLRLMLARLDLAQPSLDNIRAKWTDAALNKRIICRDYPARPTDITIAVPTLAAYNNILQPLQLDFNDAMFNIRQAIDLYLQVCDQPGITSTVGDATTIGALNIVNLADSQVLSLRSRLLELVPAERELAADECLFTYKTQQEILKVITVGQIVRQKFKGPEDRTFGWCIDLVAGQSLSYQSIAIKGTNPAPLVALAPFDNPTAFVVTQQGAPTVLEVSIAPIIISQSGRYLFILSAQAADPVTVNGELAFVFSFVPTSGIVGKLLYDATNDIVFQAVPVTGGGFVPTNTPGGVQSIIPPGNTSGVTCPSLAFTCSQFFTCQEARACLAAGNTSLDPDGNGVPCENICAP